MRPQPMAPLYPQTGYAPPYPVPQQRKSRVGLIVALAVGIPILAVVALVGLGLAFNAMADEKPASAADQSLVLKVADLEPYLPGLTVHPGAEKTIRRTNVDGSWEVENLYESDELFLLSTYEQTDDSSDAAMTMSAINGGTSIGYSGTQVTEEERNDLMKWGDASKFYIVRNAGNPIGNRLLARKGGKVIHIAFSGIYFTDRDSIHELLDPLLRRVSAAP